DDGLRRQRDHVGAEPHQQLRRRLAADAAVDVRLAREGGRQRPHVRDRIAVEHDALLARGGWLQLRVGRPVPFQLAKIVHVHALPSFPPGVLLLDRARQLGRRRLLAVRASRQREQERELDRKDAQGPQCANDRQHRSASYWPPPSVAGGVAALAAAAGSKGSMAPLPASTGAGASSAFFTSRVCATIARYTIPRSIGRSAFFGTL